MEINALFYENEILTQVELIGVDDKVTAPDKPVRFLRVDDAYILPTYKIGDFIYVPESHCFDSKLMKSTDYRVEKYVVRSISVSVNHDNRCTRNYRIQQVNENGNITSIGFNFTNDDIGKIIFDNEFDAQEICDILNNE